MSFVIMILFFKIFAYTGCHQSKHAANMRSNVIQTRYHVSQLHRTPTCLECVISAENFATILLHLKEEEYEHGNSGNIS